MDNTDQKAYVWSMRNIFAEMSTVPQQAATLLV